MDTAGLLITLSYVIITIINVVPCYCRGVVLLTLSYLCRTTCKEHGYRWRPAMRRGRC